MANNIRVYELARELGMTNAQVIELCGTLGIGVKGHSSGMPEPQADRVRRKAEREGLVNEVGGGGIGLPVEESGGVVFFVPVSAG